MKLVAILQSPQTPCRDLARKPQGQLQLRRASCQEYVGVNSAGVCTPVCVQVCAYLCVCAVVRMPVVYMCVFLKLIQHSRWQRNWQYKETILEAGT